MQFTASAQDALLRWVNTFDAGRTAASLEDLADGVTMGEMLHDIDPSFDTSTLERNVGNSWLEKKRNLEAVNRGLSRYARQDESTANLPLVPSEFRQITETLDPNGICQMLAVFAAVIFLDANLQQKYLGALNRLGDTSRREIAQIVQEKHRLAEVAKLTDDALATDPQGQDVDLKREEEIATLVQQNDTLKKQASELLTRLEHLNFSYDDLKAELVRTQEELEVARKAHGEGVSQRIRELERQLREKEELIATQEHDIEDALNTRRRLEQQVAQLSRKLEQLDGMDDRVRELESERNELQKTVNTLKKYESLAKDYKRLERECDNLRYENDQQKEQLAEHEKLKYSTDQHRATISEYKQRFANYEQDIFEKEQLARKVHEENNDLRYRVTMFEDKNQQLENLIKEQQDQLLSGTYATQPQTPADDQAAFNLEQELDQEADPAVANLKYSLAKLKAENELLRNNMGVGAENERLRTELDLLKRKESRLQEKYEDIFEKFTVGQEQLNALADKMPTEGDTAFSNLRKGHLQLTLEHERDQKKIAKLEAESKDAQRELIAARTDLNAVGKDSIDALEVLKSSDALVSQSLRQELESLRKQLDGRNIDAELQKQQLMDALLSKEALRKDLDEARRLPSTPAMTPEDAKKDSKESSEQTKKLKAALRQKMEQLEKAEQEKYDIQRRLKAVESGAAYAAQKATNEQIIKNLQRENAMITTAWYDLTSRLQSNHVVLQRKPDVPKSWLNKQRQMVNATPRR